jgi:hypothetical protein
MDLSGTPLILISSTFVLHVDVGLMLRVAHAGHDDHDARTAGGICGDADGRDVARQFGFDPASQLPELRPIERSAGDLADLLLQSRTEPREFEAGDLCGRHLRAVGRIGLLAERRSWRHQQDGTNKDEQSAVECSHAGST